jgi:hypothetical protein
VEAKIDFIKKAFCNAHNFATSETGSAEDEGSFEDVIQKKKCKWYFELLEIFQDHASIKPKMCDQ